MWVVGDEDGGVRFSDGTEIFGEGRGRAKGSLVGWKVWVENLHVIFGFMEKDVQHLDILFRK